MAPEKVWVKSTNAAGFIILLCALLYALAFLTQNMAPGMLALALSLFLIYHRILFSLRLKAMVLDIQRKPLSNLYFLGAPMTIKVSVDAGACALRLHLKDSPPQDLELISGSIEAEVAPGQTQVEFTYTLKGKRRGYHRLGPIQVVVTDGLSLFKATLERDPETQLLLHTDPAAIKKAARLAKRQSFEMVSKADKRTPRSRSAEYEGVRDYAAGDRLRDVDWKATSRMTKMMTKIFEAEATIPVVLLLDCSRSMRTARGPASKMDYGIQSAQELLKVLQSRNHPIGFISYSEQRVLLSLAPLGTKGQYDRVLTALRSLPQNLKEEDKRMPGSYKVRGGKALKENEKEFLGKVGPFVSRDLGLGGTVESRQGPYLAVQKALKGSSRGMLIMLISDLETDVNSVYSAVSLARAKKNKVFVLSLYSPWFTLRKDDISPDMLEQMYEEFTAKESAHGMLKKLGADVLSIGPKSSSPQILKGLRRYAA